MLQKAKMEWTVLQQKEHGTWSNTHVLTKTKQTNKKQTKIFFILPPRICIIIWIVSPAFTFCPAIVLAKGKKQTNKQTKFVKLNTSDGITSSSRIGEPRKISRICSFDTPAFSDSISFTLLNKQKFGQKNQTFGSTVFFCCCCCCHGSPHFVTFLHVERFFLPIQLLNYNPHDYREVKMKEQGKKKK